MPKRGSIDLRLAIASGEGEKPRAAAKEAFRLRRG